MSVALSTLRFQFYSCECRAVCPNVSGRAGSRGTNLSGPRLYPSLQLTTSTRSRLSTQRSEFAGLRVATSVCPRVGPVSRLATESAPTDVIRALGERGHLSRHIQKFRLIRETQWPVCNPSLPYVTPLSGSNAPGLQFRR